MATAAVVVGAVSGQAQAADDGLGARGPLLIARDADAAGNASDLWLREPATGEERNLTNGDGTTMFAQAAWSPDGTKIAYVRQTKNADGEFVGDVYVMNANGSDVVNISQDIADDRDPAWSPDGSKIAYASDQTGMYEIFVATLGSYDLPTQITPYGSMAATAESLDPTWSRTGTDIAFEHRTDAPEIPGPDVENAAQIYRVTLGTDGRPNNLAALTNQAGTDNRDPAYSPDSDTLAFSRDADAANADVSLRGNYGIYTRSSDAAVTSAPVRVSAAGASKYAGSPQWMPRLTTAAPQRLVFARTLSGNDAQLRQIDVATATDTLLFESVGADFEGAFQPLPGCDVVWDGGAAGTNGSWLTGANWDTDATPQTSDRVCIPDLKTDETIVLASAANLTSLTTREDFELAGGALTVGRITIEANKTVTMTSGAVTRALGGSGVLSGGTFSWNNDVALGSWEIGSDATLDLFEDDWYSLPAGQTLVNRGVIQLAGGMFNGGQLTNTASGEIRVTGTSTRDLDVAFDNDGSLAVGGGIVRLTAGDPNDGTSLSSDSGSFDVSEGAALQWTEGTHRLAPAVQLSGAGEFHLAGATLDVGTAGLTAPGEFHVDSGTLTGSGPLAGEVFHWAAGVTLGSWEVTPTTTLELSEAATYTLPVGKTLTNNGVITLEGASVAGGGQLVSTAAAEIHKTGSTPSAITSGLANAGTIRVDAATLDLPGSATYSGTSLYGEDGNSLAGGRYVVASGAKLRLSGVQQLRNNLAVVVLHGTGDAIGAGEASLLSGLQSNTGTLRLLDGAEITTEALDNSGSLELAGAARLATPALTITPNGVLTGAGTIVGAVVNAGGTVAPEGTLGVTGSYTQTPDGVLAIDITGDGADALTVTEAATTAGRVTFDVADDAQLIWSDAFPFVTAATATADPTTSYTTPASPAGLEYRVLTNPSALVFDVRDVVAPDVPAAGAATASSGHAVATWSNQREITLSLPDGQDNAGGSGFKGYVTEWVNAATNQVETVNGLTATLPTGIYGVRVKAEDNDGNLSAATTLIGEFWIDATKPTGVALTAPRRGARYSLLTSRKTPKVAATWQAATDADSGIDSYRLLSRWIAPGSATWVKADPRVTTATSKTISVKPGATYCLRVEATDVAGNVRRSGERCVAVPLDNAALRRSGTWATPASSRYYRGSAVKTTAVRAALSTTNVRTRRVGLVASTCPTCGRVAVYLGKTKLASVSLATRKPKHQVLVPVKALTKSRSGRVLIQVVSKGKPVVIDGVAIFAN